MSNINMKTLSLKDQYQKKVKSALAEAFGYANMVQVPKVEKVTVNVGVGRIHKESQEIQSIMNELAQIIGQKPLETKSKKSIAGFKVREDVTVGGKGTLRGKRMWDFLDRLVHIALPRTRDFQGIPVSNIDTEGNLNMGIKEHSIFPEMKPEKLRRTFGLQVTVTTTAKNHEEGMVLFRELRFPLQKTEERKD